MTKEYPVMIEGQQYIVIVSDETEALLAAKAAGMASVGLWKKGCGQDLSMTKYLIESWEDLSPEFLEQAVRRYQGLPWMIAETKRLMIREFQPGDEIEMQRKMEEGEADKIFGSQESLKEYIRYQYGFYGYGIWAVIEKESGKMAGRAGVVNLVGQWENIGDPDALELGYYIFLPYRRHGYGLEVCKGILEWYQGHMDCPLYARIDASNEASRNLIKKLGFNLKDQKYIESGRLQCLYGWNC